MDFTKWSAALFLVFMTGYFLTHVSYWILEVSSFEFRDWVGNIYGFILPQSRSTWASVLSLFVPLFTLWIVLWPVLVAYSIYHTFKWLKGLRTPKHNQR
jgi:hypothetical protein